MAFINEKAHDQSAKLAEERGPVPELGAVHLQERAAAPELDRHHHRPDRHHLDDRRLLLRASSRPSRSPSPTRWAIGCCPSRTRSSPRSPGSVASTRTPLMEEVAKRGVVHGLAGVPEDVQRVFVTAHEVSFEWHVRHQGAFQKYTDNGRLQDHQPPQLRLPRRRRRARTSSPGSSAASASPCSATAARRASSTWAPRRAAATSARKPPPSAPTAVVKPRPRSLTGRTYRVETPLGTAYIVVNEQGDGSPSRSSSRWARPGPTRWRSPRPWAA